MYPLALHKGHRRRRYLFWTVFLAILVAVIWMLSYYSYEYFSREDTYEQLIKQAARRHGIDSRLLKAVIWHESRFDRDARGGMGEVGLMQIRPGPNFAAQDWANYHRVERPCAGMLFNPAVNIEVGAWYLAQALRRWRKYDAGVELALCDYNAGPTKTRTWRPTTYSGQVMNRIGYEGTRAYVRSIMKKYRKLKAKSKE